MQFPRKAKGMTLIELILGMLIMTISLGGFYLGTMTIAKYLFEPEKTLNAINVVEFYQNKIAHLNLPRDCSNGNALQELIQPLCDKTEQNLTVYLNPEEVPWARSFQMQFSVALYTRQPRVYKIQTTLLENKSVLFTSVQLKGAP